MGDDVALVTGASRGIGKASALALAAKGFRVAVSARTMKEGEQREHSSTITKSDSRPLPGSVETTVAAIEEAGGEALGVPLDLLDRASLEKAVDAVLNRWGRIDLLVNNAIYVGPGTMDRLLDVPIEIVETILQANVVSQLVLTRLVLPGMLERQSGTIVNMSSTAGTTTPPAPAGEGGWGMAYGMSKGAFHRQAGFLHVELGHRGIRAFNVNPGYVVTERARALGDGSFDHLPGATPETIGAAIAWLATSPDADEFRGRTVDAQRVTRERGLLAEP